MDTRRAFQGLTLIEVLIALAIIAIALTAIIKTTSQNVIGTTYLEDKAIANWVATQALNEARLGLINGSGGNVYKTIMLGKKWYWNVASAETPNPHISKLSVSVSPNENLENNRMLTLESFYYHAQT